MANENQTPTRNAGRLAVFLILLTSFFTMIAATAISVGYSVHRYWENVLRAEITRDLTQKAQMFARRVNTDRKQKMETALPQEQHSPGPGAPFFLGNAPEFKAPQMPGPPLMADAPLPNFCPACE